MAHELPRFAWGRRLREPALSAVEGPGRAKLGSLASWKQKILVFLRSPQRLPTLHRMYTVQQAFDLARFLFAVHIQHREDHSGMKASLEICPLCEGSE